MKTATVTQKELRELRSVLRKKNKEFLYFLEVGKALTSTLEFDRVLHLIMERVQQMIRSESWSILLVEGDTQELYFELVKGRKSEEVKNVRIKLGEGIAGKVAETGRPLLVTDVSKDFRFASGVDKVTGLGVRSVLALPVINKKKTVGVLEWLNKKNGGDFTKQDLQLASRWTDQAAIVIERSNLYQVMANLAVTDDLTKLFNFRYLDQALEAEIKRCRRYKSTVSVIFLDLDRFKLVNDNHGHLMGSKTLKEVAHILVDNLRDVDIIARYGGDEFVVVLPYTPSDVAYKITLRLQRAIQQYRFLSDEGLSLNVTASFGLAGFPQHASNKTDLIRLADQAMYEAKNRGRDRIVISEPLLSSTPAV